MAKVIDVTGLTFGRLKYKTVMKRIYAGKTQEEAIALGKTT